MKYNLEFHIYIYKDKTHLFRVKLGDSELSDFR